MVGAAIYIVAFLICAWAAVVAVAVGLALLGAIFMAVAEMLRGLCGFVDWAFKEGRKVTLTIVSGVAFWIAGAKFLPPNLVPTIVGVVVVLVLLVALAIMVKDFVEWFRGLPKIRIRIR